MASSIETVILPSMQLKKLFDAEGDDMQVRDMHVWFWPTDKSDILYKMECWVASAQAWGRIVDALGLKRVPYKDHYILEADTDE